ncbi:hypothetical protein HKD37_04G010122 [Glycine soja]
MVLPRDPVEEPSFARKKLNVVTRAEEPSSVELVGRRFFRGYSRKKVLPRVSQRSISFSRKKIIVRTRGLGRVLGTGRGRETTQDAPEADVPRRRWPTASACRQQVRVPEDVAQRPEDGPQLHEDAPHVSDGTPDMTSVADAVDTEGVATETSLGSPAVHEGFPGGPRDPSVLTGYAEHVAHNIWSDLHCWIYEHFPSMHTCFVDTACDEGSPRACRWLTGKAHMTGIKGAPYRTRMDAFTVTDVSWMPYAEHRGVRGFDLISSYTGQLRWGQLVVYTRPERVTRQFGYIQTVPPTLVTKSLMSDEIDDWWIHFSDHLVGAGEICVVLGQVALDYMEWFFWISHPFVTPTEETLEPRQPPPPHVEEFIEPPILEVSVASNLPMPFPLALFVISTENAMRPTPIVCSELEKWREEEVCEWSVCNSEERGVQN